MSEETKTNAPDEFKYMPHDMPLIVPLPEEEDSNSDDSGGFAAFCAFVLWSIVIGLIFFNMGNHTSFKEGANTACAYYCQQKFKVKILPDDRILTRSVWHTDSKQCLCITNETQSLKRER